MSAVFSRNQSLKRSLHAGCLLRSFGLNTYGRERKELKLELGETELL
jgi:hypothetical protein